MVRPEEMKLCVLAFIFPLDIKISNLKDSNCRNCPSSKLTHINKVPFKNYELQEKKVIPAKGIYQRHLTECSVLAVVESKRITVIRIRLNLAQVFNIMNTLSWLLNVP